jgi:Zn-dependent M28 family amino/carboxypeptidase
MHVRHARFLVALVVSAFALTTALAASQSAGAAAAPTPRFTADELMAHVRTLASAEFEGRRVGTPGNAKARAWIVEQFRIAKLVAIGDSFEQPFTFTRGTSKLEGVNVIGLCRGTRGTDGNAMVISAHYDHLGVREGATYFGADDNASGVTVLLALARHCAAAPWTHSAMFVAFDAEEGGLQGARAFVASPPIPKARIALNVNLDMVARGDKGELYVAGTHHHPRLKPPLDAVAARAPIKLLFGHDQPKETAGGVEDWTMQSDHGPFHAAGIPFVYFGVEDHPDYHKPTDTADKVDAKFFFAAAATILDAVTALDRVLP